MRRRGIGLVEILLALLEIHLELESASGVSAVVQTALHLAAFAHSPAAQAWNSSPRLAP